jgi:hypothetical protein
VQRKANSVSLSVACFAGNVSYQCTIDKCYSTGKVEFQVETNPNDKGFAAFIQPSSLLTGNFYDYEASEQQTGNGATGKSSSEMKIQQTFTDADWNFITTWEIADGDNDGYPVHKTGSSNIEEETFKRSITLVQNYPNPFNPETKISFTLNKTDNVELTIYNASGEIVEQLVNQKLSQGTHNFSFNAINLNSGVYFYRISTKSGFYCGKMLLVK